MEEDGFKIMITYRQRKVKLTNIKVNKSIIGETLERKIERMVNNGEPIASNPGSEGLIYTERKEGVLSGYNIRTDRFDVALDAMDKVSRSKAAKRDAATKAEVPGPSKEGENKV